MVAGIEASRPAIVMADTPEQGLAQADMAPLMSFSPGNIEGFRKAAEKFICGENRMAVRNRVLAAVNYIVDPTDAQLALLDEVKTKASENDKAVQMACDKYSAMGDDFLSMMEKRHLVLTTALSLMDNMQPSIKAFYTSLDQNQISRLKEIAPPQIAKHL